MTGSAHFHMRNDNPEYKRGYAAGYYAAGRASRIAENMVPAPRPKPDWLQAAAELCEKLGREKAMELLATPSEQHVDALFEEIRSQIPETATPELHAEMRRTVADLTARMKLNT